MKIVEYTSTKLTIQQNRPVKHWIIGMIFMIVGLIAIVGPQQVMTLTCDRVSPNNGTCELVHSSLLFSNVTSIPLENLQEAKTQANPTSPNESYRIVLVTKTDVQIPLMNEYSSDLEHQEMIAVKIKNFIDNINELSLMIEEDRRLFSYLFGAFFLLAGLVGSGVITQEFTCEFDKTVGCLTLIKKGFLWTRRIKKSLYEIIGLQVETNQKQAEKKTYRISLLLASGKCIGLASGYESNRGETKKLINCLTTFLNIGVTNNW